MGRRAYHELRKKFWRSINQTQSPSKLMVVANQLDSIIQCYSVLFTSSDHMRSHHGPRLMIWWLCS